MPKIEFMLLSAGDYSAGIPAMRVPVTIETSLKLEQDDLNAITEFLAEHFDCKVMEMNDYETEVKAENDYFDMLFSEQKKS